MKSGIGSYKFTNFGGMQKLVINVNVTQRIGDNTNIILFQTDEINEDKIIEKLNNFLSSIDCKN